MWKALATVARRCRRRQQPRTGTVLKVPSRVRTQAIAALGAESSSVLDADNSNAPGADNNRALGPV